MVGLRPYPASPARAAYRILTDLVAILGIAASVFVGLALYRVVMSLEAIADGISATGHTFDGWIADFRSHIPDHVPLVSDQLHQLSDALQRNTGRPLITQAAVIHDRIHSLAVTSAIIVGAIPILLILVNYGWGRWAEMREMGAAAAFVAAARRQNRQRQAAAALAYRAVATLPFRKLMRATPDPVGDLSEQRYGALAGAMLRHAGLRERSLALAAGGEIGAPPAPPLPPSGTWR